MAAEDVRVVIPYRPRRWAEGLHGSCKRFAALVLHRRAGKTTAVANHHGRYALDDAWERRRLLYLRPSLTTPQVEELIHPPGGRHYGHVMPTRVQAKTVVWDKIKFYFRDVPGIRPNETELLMRFPNGNKLQLFGADDPDALRGPAFSGLSFDEFSQQPRNIFSEVLSKALADHLGYAIFLGTIKGKDHLYDHYQAAKNSPDWFALWQDIDKSLLTEDGITVQLLQQAMEDDRKLVGQGLMSQAEFDQEWYLSPEAAIKGAIYGPLMANARREGRIGRVPYDPTIKVNTDWDLGVGDSTAIWFTQTLYSGAVNVIDYYESSGEGLPHYIDVLNKKPYVYGEHWAPHDIEQREVTSGNTRRDTARKMGINFLVLDRVERIEDRVHATRMLLPRCFFDEKNCAHGLETLIHYRWAYNKQLDENKTTPIHDWASHGADAFGGLAYRHYTPKYNPERQAAKALKLAQRDTRDVRRPQGIGRGGY